MATQAFGVRVKLARWGNSLAIRVPAEIVRAEGLKEGDEITLRGGDGRDLLVSTRADRRRILDESTEFADRIPPGYRFDRDEANER